MTDRTPRPPTHRPPNINRIIHPFHSDGPIAWGLFVAVAAALSAPGPVRAEPPAREAVKAAKAARGALLIVGGGTTESIRNRFLELGGGEKARLVVIPTASPRSDMGVESHASYAFWSAMAKERKLLSVSFLHTRKREEADDPKFVKPLLEASAVWFTGGDQVRLTDAYKDTAVEREVRAVFDRGGVVGGTSAGAAVMSAVMIRSGNPIAEVGAGFGFVSNLIVDQHFQERNRLPRLLGVLAKHPNFLGLGIDERTAVELRGSTVTVLGERNVRLCLPTPDPAKPEVKVFAVGSEVDLEPYTRALRPATPPTTAKGQ